MHGVQLPSGLQESEQLPEPVFTPSTKAEQGLHDENISFDKAVELVGGDVANRAREISLELYRRGSEWAAARGILVADTKFELGFIDGELVVCDEVLTPDSSRFWPEDTYEPGRGQPSFDKQYVRDWLDASGWKHEPPPPELPADVVEQTAARYREAYERITGEKFDEYLGRTGVTSAP
jgi:phosphoribosylaminoimidazole-succinocarboxamide synthase